MEETYTDLMSDVDFQEYVMQCRHKAGEERRIRTAQARAQGHTGACMLTRGGDHCTCPKEAA